MSETFHDLFNWRDHKVQDTTLVAGGAAAATPTNTLSQVLPQGNWLATHGVGVLTWVEIIQIIGAIGVLVAILNGLARFVMWGRRQRQRKKGAVNE